jgi:hypothetical protein
MRGVSNARSTPVAPATSFLSRQPARQVVLIAANIGTLLMTVSLGGQNRAPDESDVCGSGRIAANSGATRAKPPGNAVGTYAAPQGRSSAASAIRLGAGVSAAQR